MPSKGTKQIRLGRIERFLKLEMQPIGDLDACMELLTEYERGLLQGRIEAARRLAAYLDLEVELNG